MDWIIVVDDDLTNLKMAGHILSRNNMRVTALKSGTALIDYLKTGTPDLILLDINMPGLDGFETMKLLKAQDSPARSIPVIFLTADENQESETRGLALGAMDFIKKPFVPDVLLLRVRHIIDLVKLQHSLERENKRISSELAMASRLQAAMLPSLFPAFPDREDIDIYASMNPARGVGGDFYDFFFLDHDHLCMLIADVSGKGIPAALFMMVSKTILAENARAGRTPAQILNVTNEMICANNPEEMFVTVWLGILEISTGVLTATNAGHEYPVLLGTDGSNELIKRKQNIAIGAFSESRYSEYQIRMTPGTKLFLYTDGLPEASDSDGNFFGMERMMDSLKAYGKKGPKEVLQGMGEAVSRFAREKEQFDDLTMLCMEYMPGCGEQ